MTAVPMAGTGDGPRPDSTTFTRDATDRPARDRSATDRLAAADTAE